MTSTSCNALARDLLERCLRGQAPDELPPALVAQTKRAVNEGLDLPLVEGLALERRIASLRN